MLRRPNNKNINSWRRYVAEAQNLYCIYPNIMNAKELEKRQKQFKRMVDKGYFERENNINE